VSESFSVGEIVELVYSRYESRTLPMEVKVVGLPEQVFDRIAWVFLMAYSIEVDGVEYYALPEQLRKRRPPQDWVKLCNLTDIPREVTCG